MPTSFLDGGTTAKSAAQTIKKMNDSVGLPHSALVIVLTMTLILIAGCAATRNITGANGTPPATLSVDNSSLNFGSVLVGARSSLPLTVTNSANSGRSITVSQITVSATAFTLSGPPLPLILGPAQSAKLIVVFAPVSVASANGTLAIASDAANSTISIALSGAGTKSAQLSVVPAALNFGTINLGKRQTLTARLKSSGAAITVSSASWNGSGYSLSGISFPATVPVGQQVSFNVTFAPQAAGTSSGVISFVNNGSGSPLSVPLSGNGVLHSVTLNWNPSTSSVQGYYVYRGGISGGPFFRLSGLQSSLSYTDANVTSGQTYYYVVTALGTDSVESSYSNQVAATIP